MATNNGFIEGKLNVREFSKGINEQIDDTLVKFNESTKAYNVDNSMGTLKPYKVPTIITEWKDNIIDASSYYSKTKNTDVMLHYGDKLQMIFWSETWSNNATSEEFSGYSSDRFDTLNFEYQGEKILVMSNGTDVPLYYSYGDTIKKIKNRRPGYNEEGEIDKWYDADGKEHESEDTIETYAPKGKFIELHYDRLWIAGDKENPDRVYFSTADQRGFDIQDFTMPIDEEEANMHGGFVDVPSFDGGKIIGLKVIFNDLVIFKDKTIFKIYGNNPSNYQIVNLHNSNGAISDSSIACGNNGAFFLNTDGIHFYDGTNVNLISQKIQGTIQNINKLKSDIIRGYYNDSKYYLAVPLGKSYINNAIIIYDTNTNSYMIVKDINVTSFFEYNKRLYFTDNNKICTFSDIKCDKPLPGYNDNRGYMNVTWETPYNDIGYKNAKKRSEYIYFIADGEGALTVDCITDSKTKSINIPISGETKVYKKKLKNKGRIFKLRFSTKDGKYINVTNPELLIEVDID